ncbi:hypothetical protein [[Muricauda] lutisoli]|uniref:Pentapeptide repeat-containing protein n=1 Tax=[Muricauda] lutisoli TaxID=2816035 RepID=A0ABS3EYC6_9FLAO|nr:hypothetical protein [[Muricauda] lutisoli]MBO0331127.1 hypothetical protein [[Muricauda] lutisoli]
MKLTTDFFFGNKLGDIIRFIERGQIGRSLKFHVSYGFEITVGILIEEIDEGELCKLDIQFLQKKVFPSKFEGAKLEINDTFINQLIGVNSIIQKVNIRFLNLKFNDWVQNPYSTFSLFEVVLESKSIPINVEFDDIETNWLMINGNATRLSVNSGKFSKIGVRGEFSLLSIFNNTCVQAGNPLEEYIHVDDIISEKIEINHNVKFNRIFIGNNFTNNLNCFGNNSDTLTIQGLSFFDACIMGNEIVNMEMSNLGNMTLSEPSKLRLGPNRIEDLLVISDINFTKRTPRGSTLFINGKNPTLFEFHYKCTFNKLILRNLDWSYINILENNTYKNSQLSAILKLKSSYQVEGNLKYERIFRAFEKRWHNENGKFNLALSLGWISNRFGLSLLRSFLWMLGLIIFEGLFILMLSIECLDCYFANWGLLFHLLNPAHRTESLLGLVMDCSYYGSIKNWLYLIDNVFRILIGYALYQFVMAFRYLYDLK